MILWIIAFLLWLIVLRFYPTLGCLIVLLPLLGFIYLILETMP